MKELVTETAKLKVQNEELQVALSDQGIVV